MNFVPQTLYFVLFLWAHGLTDLSTTLLRQQQSGLAPDRGRWLAFAVGD